jgi:uncharacterized protein (TIGR02444 family)
MPAAANPFWHFSLRAWRVPGVQAACLALQEHRGADVNLLLFCGWTGREGRELDRRDLRQAIGCVGNWQNEVIAPLRLARRGLKHQRAGTPAAALAPTFRDRFLALELALEQAEQALLADLAAQWAPVGHDASPRQAVAANLDCYLGLLTKPAGPDEPAHLAQIVEACSAAKRRAA